MTPITLIRVEVIKNGLSTILVHFNNSKDLNDFIQDMVSIKCGLIIEVIDFSPEMKVNG